MGEEKYKKFLNIYARGVSLVTLTILNIVK